MVIESSSATATTTLLLTSGASGRVNALLSWRALKSMFLLIKASLFFLLLLPFQLARTATTTNTTTTTTTTTKRSSSSSSSSPTSTSSSSKNEKKHHLHLHLHHHIKNPFFLRRIPTPPPMVTVVPHLTSNNNNNNNNNVAAGAMVVVSGDSDVAARRALAINRATQDDDTCTRRQVSLFLTSRGDTLFTQSWTPPLTLNIRGVVVLLHGLNEHSGRYGNFAKKLNANGYKVYGMDWIGHGGSDGLHAYVHSLDYAVNDMKAFIEKIVAENEGLPCFCFGHSTGAAIVLKSMLDQRIKVLVKGVVLTSPAVRVQASHPIFGVLAPIFSFLLPTYQFRAANKNGTCVSRDPDALIAKYTDPLVYTGSIRVRTGYEILRISSCLQQHISRLTTPFLVLHGTCDAVTDPGASVELHEKAASTDKSIKLYNGLLHDLLFEPEREVVAKDIIDWLNSRV